MLKDTELADRFKEREGQWTATARVLVGLIFLYEALLGGWWKVGNPEWVGAEAGATLTETAQGAIDGGTYGWYVVFLENAIIPYAEFWSYSITAMNLIVALALLFGFWTRLAALGGILYFAGVWHLGPIRTSPLFSVPIAFMLFADSGRYYGIDAFLRKRDDAFGRITRQIGDTKLFPRRAYPAVIALFGVVGLYYLLSIAGDMGLTLVGLELTVFSAMVVAGLALVYKGASPIGAAADMVRVFVGYRFIQEIFIRSEPGVNALPGWAPAAEQAEVFESIAAAHVAPVAAFIETAILPAMGAWVVAFALIQTAVGVALFVGYRTRLFGAIGVGYLVFLIVLGFVRLAPLLLMSALVAAFLGGRHLSLDSVADRTKAPPALPTSVAPVAAAAGVVFVIAGAVIGVVPGGYGETTGAITLVFLGFIAVSLAVGARVGRDTTSSTEKLSSGVVE